MTIRVLIVDDSAIVRQVLSKIINEASGMEVMDVAQDPIFALKKLQSVKPDVIVLDVEMPRMDGLTFLEKIMAENPLPVVMCSTLTERSSKTSVKALSLGAVEVVGKPKMNLKDNLQDSKKEIIDAIRAAAQAKLKKLNISAAGRTVSSTVKKSAFHVPKKETADVVLAKKATIQAAMPTSQLVAIGTSTGGTQALEYVIPRLHPQVPGVVVVQHMPEAFTAAFADRLNGISQVYVKEAENGEPIQTGKVLIAPGGKHMLVDNKGGHLSVIVKDGPLVSRHRPSVDVLFRSVAQTAARKTLGIIMTGMGDDGATGMRELFDNGAFTIAQDEKSCVIFGMPSVAIEKGGVKKITPLSDIPNAICAFATPTEFKKYINNTK